MKQAVIWWARVFAKEGSLVLSGVLFVFFLAGTQDDQESGCDELGVNQAGLRAAQAGVCPVDLADQQQADVVDGDEQATGKVTAGGFDHRLQASGGAGGAGQGLGWFSQAGGGRVGSTCRLGVSEAAETAVTDGLQEVSARLKRLISMIHLVFMI